MKGSGFTKTPVETKKNGCSSPEEISGRIAVEILRVLPLVEMSGEWSVRVIPRMISSTQDVGVWLKCCKLLEFLHSYWAEDRLATSWGKTSCLLCFTASLWIRAVLPGNLTDSQYILPVVATLMQDVTRIPRLPRRGLSYINQWGPHLAICSGCYAHINLGHYRICLSLRRGLWYSYFCGLMISC